MNTENYKALLQEINQTGASLVAVSKTKPVESILELYNLGQRIFGENKVQELATKHGLLPADIEWHLIGHLQTNKVKQAAPLVSMIHSVDSLKLLVEINKQAERNNRVINCLLQIFIADEETKFGLSEQELKELLQSEEFEGMKNIRICGLMGMATNTDDEEKIGAEFEGLQKLFGVVKEQYFKGNDYFKELSIGMSSDYKIALKHGATLVRLGSVIFGER
ncbi:MAG: alanine racemase domain protein [Bacteroidota bacterium]|nr:alanine racemase domain protein [Bacteroidota bacterium]